LPKDALGPAAALLPLDRDSGVVTNAKAAENANSTKLTAADFVRLGRITGYTLDYNDAGGRALAAGHGLLQVQTAVELYRTAADAVRGLAFHHRDDASITSFKIPGFSVSLTALEPPPVGTARFGYVAAAHVKGKPSVYGADVFFVNGRIVGEVSVSAADRASAPPLALALTTKLANRIAGVIAGTIGGPAVTLPGKAKAGPPPGGPALAPLALTPADLGGGTITHQGYKLDTDLNPISDYERTITGGPFLSFEEQVELFHSTTEADYTVNLLGRAMSSKAFFQQVAGAELKGRNIVVTAITPVRVSAGDEALAARATFETSGLNFYAAFIFVRVGRTIEAIYAIGPQIQPSSIAGLAALAGTRASEKLK